MTPLGPGEVQARRRPLVILGIAAFRALFGLCLAWPLASLVAESGVGSTAHGDRALFEGGGYLLLEMVRLKGADLLAAARGLVPLLAIGLGLTVVSNAALLVALNVRGRLEPQLWLSRALSHVPGLALLGIVTGFAQLLLFGAAAIASGAAPEPLEKPLLTSGVQLGIWLLAALAAGALGGFSDVVKAALVRHGLGPVAALGPALQSIRRRPLQASLGFLPFALVFLLAALAASSLTSALDVSRPGPGRLALVFALHQLVIVLGVALRAGWFSRALRLAASPVS